MSNSLLEVHRSSVYTSPWLDCIKNICTECGMAGVWMMQTINNIVQATLPLRVLNLRIFVNTRVKKYCN